MFINLRLLVIFVGQLKYLDPIPSSSFILEAKVWSSWLSSWVSGAAILVGFADQCGDLTSHNDHVNLQIGGTCCHGKCQHDRKGLEDPSSKDILSNCVDRKMKYMLFCINIKILVCIYIDIHMYCYISHIC